MENRTLYILAFLAVSVAVINLSVTYLKINDFREAFSGFAASDTGTINITVLGSVNINFIRNAIDWGTGVVYTNNSNPNATLTTRGNGQGLVVGGNWSSSGVYGLIIANNGSVNVTLNLSTDKNHTDLFGVAPSGLSALQWNITDKDSGSCAGGNLALNTFYDVNKTVSEIACTQLGSASSKNEIFLDFYIMIPADYDAAAKANLNQQVAIYANATVAP
ncbi:hypothetical protein GOV14_04415 [Candidatus Pacearchaeota archaeon]|nr:hypothetical protein [Candidatus Pacearchaeota archaeon]